MNPERSASVSILRTTWNRRQGKLPWVAAWLWMVVAPGVAAAAPVPLAIVNVTVGDAVNNQGVGSGNNDGIADPGETVNLFVEIKNVSGSTLFDLNGELSASFGGVDVPVTNAGPADYGDLAGNSSGSNSIPFTVPISQNYACGGRLSLHLTVRTTGGSLVAHLWYSLPIGENQNQRYEATTPVGTANTSNHVLERRGDGFGLFYIDNATSELNYQILGAFGEPGKIVGLGQAGSVPEVAVARVTRNAPSFSGYGIVILGPVMNAGVNNAIYLLIDEEGEIKDTDVLPLGVTFASGNCKLEWHEGADQFAMLYASNTGTRLTRFSFSGAIQGTQTLSSAYPPDGRDFELSRLGADRYAAIWETAVAVDANTPAGLVYSEVTTSGAVIQSEVKIRDPNGPGSATLATAVTDANDPNEPGVGVFWTDSRDPNNPTNHCKAPGTSLCAGQIYFRQIRRTGLGGISAEKRVSQNTPNARSPSAVWNPLGGYYEVAWSDFRESPGGICSFGCVTRFFQQRTALDGNAVSSNGTQCGASCEEKLWGNLDLVSLPILLARSQDATGHLLQVIENGEVRSKLGLRYDQNLDGELWVKEGSLRNQAHQRSAGPTKGRPVARQGGFPCGVGRDKHSGSVEAEGAQDSWR